MHACTDWVDLKLGTEWVRAIEMTKLHLKFGRQPSPFDRRRLKEFEEGSREKLALYLGKLEETDILSAEKLTLIPLFSPSVS